MVVPRIVRCQISGFFRGSLRTTSITNSPKKCNRIQEGVNRLKLYIGVDLGTSAVKLLLMDAQGEIKNVVSKEYPLEFPQPGWSQQNPEDWRKAVMEGIPELLSGFDGEEKQDTARRRAARARTFAFARRLRCAGGIGGRRAAARRDDALPLLRFCPRRRGGPCGRDAAARTGPRGAQL